MWLTNPSSTTDQPIMILRPRRTGAPATHPQEVGQQLQGLGGGVVNVPPVVRRHPGRALFRRPVVQEVGQQLGGPTRPVQALVDEVGKRRGIQEHLIREVGGMTGL